MYYAAFHPSPIGRLLLVSEEMSLTDLWMEGQKYYLGSLAQQPEENGSIPILRQAKTWLDRYFRGEQPDISELSLAPAGSNFRQEVWKILCGIPYGQTMTYGEIAKEMALRLGRQHMSAQAVGGAVGHNPISIVIPCHRVVGTGGSLTGYAGGIDKKLRLLQREGVDVSRFAIPTKGSAL